MIEAEEKRRQTEEKHLQFSLSVYSYTLPFDDKQNEVRSEELEDIVQLDDIGVSCFVDTGMVL